MSFVQISVGFLVLRADEMFRKYNASWLPDFGQYSGVVLTLLSYLLFNIIYAISSTKLGRLSDKFGRLKVLQFGTTLMFIIMVLFWITDIIMISEIVIVGFIVLGLYMASTEGVTKALIGDLTDISIRGKAYGLFNLTIGFTALFSALIFGFIWNEFGGSFAFSLFTFLSLGPIIGISILPKKVGIR